MIKIVDLCVLLVQHDILKRITQLESNQHLLTKSKGSTVELCVNELKRKNKEQKKVKIDEQSKRQNKKQKNKKT